MAYHLLKIFEAANLACCMALHGQDQLVCRNARAIVSYSNAANSAFFQVQRNVSCLRIHRIVQELLHD